MAIQVLLAAEAANWIGMNKLQNNKESSASMWMFTHLGNELSFVNVQVGPTDTASLDLDHHIVVAELGKRDFDDGIIFWLCVLQAESALMCLTLDLPSRSD